MPPPEMVAPRAGAWVEMRRRRDTGNRVLTSLPVRERGLKSAVLPVTPAADPSLPVRERGLK